MAFLTGKRRTRAACLTPKTENTSWFKCHDCTRVTFDRKSFKRHLKEFNHCSRTSASEISPAEFSTYVKVVKLTRFTNQGGEKRRRMGDPKEDWRISKSAQSRPLTEAELAEIHLEPINPQDDELKENEQPEDANSFSESQGIRNLLQYEESVAKESEMPFDRFASYNYVTTGSVEIVPDSQENDLQPESTLSEPIQSEGEALKLDEPGLEITEGPFFTSPPFIKNGTMRDYQIIGLNWLISLYEQRNNGILADEMGLGKTIQSISFLGYLKFNCGIRGPHLVIVPLSTLSNWMDEFNRWCPGINVLRLHSPVREDADAMIRKELAQRRWEVCVTTYDWALIYFTHLNVINWSYLVIDEGHRIKNENTLLANRVRTFKSAGRILLTGTPIQNNMHELWALLNFLNPEKFRNSDIFDKWFATSNVKSEADALRKVEKLHSVLKPFLLRRIKSDVEKSLAPKKEMIVYVGLTQLQRNMYKKLLLKDQELLEGNLVSRNQLINLIMQVRKICLHPYMFKGIEPEPFTTDKHLVEASGKMIVLDKLLDKLKAEGSRVLIFSQFITSLDILEDYCFWKKFDYCRLDGSTKEAERKEGMSAFNADGSPKFVYLLSTRAGGLGINLTTADVVIIFDSDFNPQLDIQAMDRCHRIGQKKEVRVFRLVTQDTIEEKILERAQIKLKLDHLVIQQGRLRDSKNKIDINPSDYRSMAQFGMDQILKENYGSISDKDIDKILAISKDRSQILKDKLEKMDEEACRNFKNTPETEGFDMELTVRPTQFHHFEGHDYRSLRQLRLKQKEMDLIVDTQRPRSYYNDFLYDDKFNNSIQINPIEEDNRPPPYKPKRLSDFHFHPYRANEIYRLESEYYFQRTEIPAVNFKGMTKSQKKILKDSEKLRLENARPSDHLVIAEKKALKAQVFADWKRKDLLNFLRGSFEFGKENFKRVAAIVNKTEEEVKEYSEAFWARCHELYDFRQLMLGSDFFEVYEEKVKMVTELLDWKVEMTGEAPTIHVKIPYKEKGRRFTQVHDDLILKTLRSIGFGAERVYDEIHDYFLNSDDPAVDSFLKMRQPTELRERISLLIACIQREKIAKKRKRSPKKEHNEDAEVKQKRSKTDEENTKVIDLHCSV